MTNFGTDLNNIPSVFYLCNIEVLLNRRLGAVETVERLSVSCSSSQENHKQHLHIKVRIVNVVKLAPVF